MSASSAALGTLAAVLPRGLSDAIKGAVLTQLSYPAITVPGLHNCHFYGMLCPFLFTKVQLSQWETSVVEVLPANTRSQISLHCIAYDVSLNII